MDPDVLVAGETLIDFLPDVEGALATVDTFTRRPGGAPANVAVALARLGRPPWFWTRVGADPFGDVLVETLAAEDVPSRFVERDAEAKTTLAFVERGADPSFVFYRDGTADTRLEPGRIPGDVLDAIEWVVLGGVTLAQEPSRAATIDLARRAHSRDCTVVFDPNARPELWAGGDFPGTIDTFLEHVDVLKATPDDLRAAGFDGDAPALADSVLERGPHTVAVTLGREGAMARATEDAPWGACSLEHAGYDVDAVDPTGAGDAFLAGLVASLSDGNDLRDCLAFANAVAAVATTGEGAMTALPDREAVEALREEERA